MRRRNQAPASMRGRTRLCVWAFFVFVLCTLSTLDISDGPSFSQQPATCVAPPKGMVSWWPGDGNANDIIGNNNGTPVGAVTFAPGKVGQAFSFNGVDSYVYIRAPINITGPITVDAWVKPNVVDSYRDILDNMSSSLNLGEVQLRINPQGTYDFFRHISQGSIVVQGVSTQTAAVAGGWQHVAAVYDGSAYYVYVDGELDPGGGPGTSTLTEYVEPGSGTAIGTTKGFPGETFDGLIDEVEIFNRALSATEIQAIFKAGSAGKCKCQPITGIVREGQDDLPWGPHPYDDLARSPLDPPTSMCPVTNSYCISEEGCALTDFSMIINYYAQQQGVVDTTTGKTFTTNPDLLNSYFNTPRLNGIGVIGYDFSGGIIPSAVVQFAVNHHVKLFYHNRLNHRDDSVLDAYVCNGYPVPIAVGPIGGFHWVIATGHTTVGGTGTYSLIDPDGYGANGAPAQTLVDFNNSYQNILQFSSTAAPLSALYIMAHSPVELLVTDPNGNQTGIDPVTGAALQGIPSSSYSTQALANDLKHNSGLTTPEEKVFEVLGPVPGNYTMTAAGAASGTYTLEFIGYDSSGNQVAQTASGITSAGELTEYNIGYSPVPGVPLTVAQSVTFQSTLADISNSLALGLIDNHGIANALSSKINAASDAAAGGDNKAASNILNAFINQVNAQTGKHINGIVPQVLLADASSLVNQLQ